MLTEVWSRDSPRRVRRQATVDHEITTISVTKSKAAIKDAARVLGYLNFLGDRIKSHVPRKDWLARLRLRWSGGFAPVYARSRRPIPGKGAPMHAVLPREGLTVDRKRGQRLSQERDCGCRVIHANAPAWGYQSPRRPASGGAPEPCVGYGFRVQSSRRRASAESPHDHRQFY